MEANKIVKSIEPKAGGKSGTYWTVTWEDGKFDNIFNGDWLPLLNQSQKENRILHIVKEKNERNPKYYNVVSLELASLPDKPVEAPQPKPSPVKEVSNSKPPIEHKSSPETGMWWGQMGEMLRCGDIDKTTKEGKTLRNAYYAEMLRVLGINISEKEVSVAKKSRLVEEAKKLGATEIEPEEDSPF